MSRGFSKSPRFAQSFSQQKEIMYCFLYCKGNTEHRSAGFCLALSALNSTFRQLRLQHTEVRAQELFCTGKCQVRASFSEERI